MVGVLTSKWMIFFYVPVLIMIILFMAGRKSVHTEVFIPASPKMVWSVLMDVPKLKEWNTVLIPIEGELIVGNSVKYEFHQDKNNIITIPAKVKQIVEGKLLNQTGGMPGILTFDHKYILESDMSGTKVVIHEDYRGAMVPFWNPDPVEQAYTRLAEALKNRVIHVAGELK